MGATSASSATGVWESRRDARPTQWQPLMARLEMPLREWTLPSFVLGRLPCRDSDGESKQVMLIRPHRPISPWQQPTGGKKHQVSRVIKKSWGKRLGEHSHLYTSQSSSSPSPSSTHPSRVVWTILVQMKSTARLNFRLGLYSQLLEL